MLFEGEETSIPRKESKSKPLEHAGSVQSLSGVGTASDSDGGSIANGSATQDYESGNIMGGTRERGGGSRKVG